MCFDLLNLVRSLKSNRYPIKNFVFHTEKVEKYSLESKPVIRSLSCLETLEMHL